MDCMLHKLEKYADNLESIVQQRTAELIEEKQKTDMLLNRMLPPYASFAIYKPKCYYAIHLQMFGALGLFLRTAKYSSLLRENIT